MQVRIMNGEADKLHPDRREGLGVLFRADLTALLRRMRDGHELRETLIDFRQAPTQGGALFFLRLGLRRAQFTVCIFHPRDESLHGVVIFGRDGIKLMIVAARATDAETEEGLADVHDDLINRILPREPDGRRILADLARQQHGCGDEKSRGRVLAHGITGDLLLDEPVIGRVVVEGADDIVAVGPGVRALGVHFKAVCVGITHNIQPVLRPAFAIARTGEEALDDG